MKKKIIIICLAVFILLIAGTIIFLGQKDIFIVINGKVAETVNINAEYKDLGSSACYGYKYLKDKKCVDISSNVKIESNVDTSKDGKYYVKYEYDYGNKKITETREVIVKDILSPVITLNKAETLVCGNSSFVEPGYSAIDEIDGDLTDRVVTTMLDKEVLYEVTDNSGNKASVIRELEYGDKTSPVITLKGYQTTYVLLDSVYNDLGATANDNCDGDITNKIIKSGSIDSSKIGKYTITYSVTDSAGNKSTKERTVQVFKKQEVNIVIPENKTIYLTFDDGPGPYTKQLLDILKKYDVKATFFVIYRPGYKALIKRAYDEGHTIGLHTASHVYRKVYASVDAYFNDLNKVSNFVKDTIGADAKLIRFPGGSSNTVSSFNKGIMTTLTKEVEFRGYRYFDWNLSSGDTSTTSQTKVENNVIKRLGNGKYYVVLQHDIKKYSVLAVERIIEYGLANGYTFAPLSYDSPMVHSKVNN